MYRRISAIKSTVTNVYTYSRIFQNIFLFQMVTRTKKIFVGGLSAPSTLEDVKNYFEQFGLLTWKSFNLKFKNIFNFYLHIIYITYIRGSLPLNVHVLFSAAQLAGVLAARLISVGVESGERL